MTIEGAVDAQVFELYVEHFFLPELFTDNTVVLDRVNFHFSQRAIDLIEAAEAEILYLPALTRPSSTSEMVFNSQRSQPGISTFRMNEDSCAILPLRREHKEDDAQMGKYPERHAPRAFPLILRTNMNPLPGWPELKPAQTHADVIAVPDGHTPKLLGLLQ